MNMPHFPVQYRIPVNRLSRSGVKIIVRKIYARNAITFVQSISRRSRVRCKGTWMFVWNEDRGPEDATKREQ